MRITSDVTYAMIYKPHCKHTCGLSQEAQPPPGSKHAQPEKTHCFDSNLQQSEEYLTRLEPVVRQLKQDIPDAEYTRESLALLILQLLQFQEEALGREVCVMMVKSKSMTHSCSSAHVSSRGQVTVSHASMQMEG